MIVRERRGVRSVFSAAWAAAHLVVLLAAPGLAAVSYDSAVASRMGAAAISGVKDYAPDLGSHWARLPTNITDSNWASPVFFDSELRDYQDSGVVALGILSPRKNNVWITPAQFASAVAQFVERYDGDGVNDMPGLVYPIKHWEFFNEYGTTNPEFSGLGHDSFARMMESAVVAMKAACATCTLVYNPFSREAADSLVARIGADSIQVISFHTYSPLDQALHPSDSFYSVNFPAHLASCGLSGKPVWATEYAFYDHLGANPPNQMAASQDANARWLVQTTVWGMATGKFERIFYAEITAPMDSTANLQWMALVDSTGAKRQNYFAFKKMASLIDYHDSVTTDSVPSNVYGYRFRIGDTFVHVLWSKEATGTHSNVTITGLAGSTVTRILAAPNQNFAFESTTLAVAGGAVTIDIPETPVYLVDVVSSAPDTSGANAWYVNDTSTAGDSFTSAVGSDANNGLSAATPRRTLAAVLPHLTAGDTVYLDSGVYAETFASAVDSVALVGMGVGASILDRGGAGGHVIALDSRVNMLVRAVEIRNAARDSQGIRLYNTHRSSILSCRIHNAGGTGLWLSCSDTNTIRDNAIDSCGRMENVRLEGTSYGNVIDSNEITNADYYGVFVSEADSNDFTRNLVRNSDYSALSFVNSDSNHVAENTIRTTNLLYGLYMSNGAGNVVRGNGVETCWDNGIHMTSNCRDNTIESQVVRGNRLGGIYIEGARNVVRFCTVSSNGREGIALSDGTANQVLSNVVRTSGSSAAAGLYIASCTGTLVARNLVDSHATHGISISGGRQNTVVANEIAGNAGYALALGGSTESVTFERNNLRGSTSRPDSLVYSTVASGATLNRDWFGTTDSSRIAARIWGSGRAKIAYTPFRLSEIDTAAGRDTVAPEAPVLAVDTAHGRITLSWTAPVANEDGHSGETSVAAYRLYRSRAADTTDWCVLLAETTAITFWDSSATFDTDYYYRVTALDNASPRINESWYSTIVRGRTSRLTADFSGDSLVTTADVLAIVPRYRVPAQYDTLYDIGRNGQDGTIDAEDLFELGRQFGL